MHCKPIAVMCAIAFGLVSPVMPAASPSLATTASQRPYARYHVTPTAQRIATGTVLDYVIPNTFGYSTIDAMTYGPDGNVWFAVYDGFFGTISPAGIVSEIPYPLTDQDYFQMISARGAVWALTSMGSLERIDLNGAVTPIRRGSVTSIAVGPEGDVWFTDQQQIGHLHPNGSISFVSTAPGQPYSLTFGGDRKPYFVNVPPQPGQSHVKLGRLEPSGSVTLLGLHVYSPSLVTSQGFVLAIGSNPLLFGAPNAKYAPDVAERFARDGTSSIATDDAHIGFRAVQPAVATASTNVYLLAHRNVHDGSQTVYGGSLQEFFGSQGPFSNPIGNILYGSALATDNANDAFVGIAPYDGHAHITIYHPLR